jgi:hypothetical protein
MILDFRGLDRTPTELYKSNKLLQYHDFYRYVRKYNRQKKLLQPFTF